MRVLCTFVGGYGHVEPLLPLARAASRAGHDVSFACGPAMVPVVARAGFPTEALDLPPPPPADDATVGPLLDVDPEREEVDLRDRFYGDLAHDRALAVDRYVRAGARPDLVVADEVDAGAAAAAERLGVPFASVVVLAAGGFARPALVGPAVARLRDRLGLPADPPAGAAPVVHVAPLPSSFRDPDWPLPAGTLHVRPSVLEPGEDASEPVWRGGRPRILVTLGTAFELESGDLLDRVVAGAAEVAGADVLVTLGRHPGARSADAAAAAVRFERFVPQRWSLAGCDVVVSHGGSGTVVGALALGVAQVVVAMGADQTHNARRVEALRVGRSLDPVRATPADVADAIHAVRTDEVAARAAELAAECRALPTADDVVAQLAAAAR